MIKTENLFKVFQTDEVETTALHCLDLHIKEGEFVAIMGPSGCGKSTLLNILGLLDGPTDGGYFFGGIDVSAYTENKRTKLRTGSVGFVFQNFNLIDELTVFDNVALPLSYMKSPKGEIKKKVIETLERVNIAHRAKHFPLQLSGGQQQRVAVARAVVASPKVIFADEPTGNLDSVNGDEVMKLLKELNNEGTTIVMVTHSPEHAKFANRTIQLLDGKIVNNENVS